MRQTITVVPRGNGWSVDSEVFENQMYFLSGGAAEAAARDLAGRLAAADSFVVVEVFARDGSLAGRHICAPAVRAA